MEKKEKNPDRWRPTHHLLCWLAPLAMAVLGTSFALWDHMAVESDGLSAHAMREVLLFGIVVPLVAWLTLRRAVAAMEARARTREEEVRDFNQQLERKVDRRTEQLSRAREEITRKAQQLQELLAKTIRIQEEERARIATDMHDGVTQLIVGTGYEIQAARERLAAEPEVAETKLRTAQALLDRIEAEIRQAIYDLRPPILSTAGLIPALKGLCNEFQALTGVPCLCRMTGDPFRLPAEVEVAVYRIVQEALHNVEAHAVACTTRVSLQFCSEGLQLTIEDDGHGFNSAAALVGNNSLGLVGMQERAQSIGGNLSLESSPGNGTRITLDIPIPGLQRKHPAGGK